MAATLYVETNFKRRTRSHEMRTVSAQMPALDLQPRRTGEQRVSVASVRSVAFEGIAVIGRDFRIPGLVLLLIIAILPG
jgi:hypothetical protein